jgi:hypothetical protein
VKTVPSRVIPSEAKNLALKARHLQNSWSPSAPRNDTFYELFNNLVLLR